MALLEDAPTPAAVRAIIDETKAAVSGAVPFTDAELDSAVKSLESLADPHLGPAAIDGPAIREVLSKAAHQPHKVPRPTICDFLSEAFDNPQRSGGALCAPGLGGGGG